jgi:hypothetical protein
MLYLMLSSLIMLALLDRALRGSRVRLMKLDLEFELFALRDELRNAMLAGQIAQRNWFDYMDTTLTRTIDQIDNINPWLAVGYFWSHRDDPYLQRANEELKAGLRRNTKIDVVYKKYVSSLMHFLESRHPISWPLAAMTFMVMCREHRSGPRSSQHDSIEQEEQKLAPVFSMTPQTSTLWDYSGVQPKPDVHQSAAPYMAVR